MEASAIHAPAGLARARISVSAPLLRLRSDDQLLALFRAGNDDAFRTIHDRYRQRLFAYTRQMLPGSTQDAEDALQDVFVRAYSGLRANHRRLALRPWLYRVAHNRCVDEIRRPVPPAPELLHQTPAPTHDPATRAEQRESLHRLITDLRRLPDQQRSALLMRELGGMSYADVAAAMDVSVPAVKSLLVRARIGLALAVEARDIACVEIRDDLTLAHDRGVRPSGTARRHLADCDSCREFRTQIRGNSRQFAALLPALGPMGILAKVLGISGGGAAGGGAGAAATGGATAGTTGAVVGGGAAASVVGGGTAASVGTFAAGASHVVTLIAAAVVTAGGAVAIQHTIAAPVPHRHADHAQAIVTPSAAPAPAPAPATPQYQARPYQAPASAPATSSPTKPATVKAAHTATGGAGSSTGSTPISGGDNIIPTARPPGGATDSTGTTTGGDTPTGTGTATGTSGTDPSGTGANETGTSGSGTSTGSGTALNGGATGSGATGSATTGTGASSSSGTGSTTATAAATGTTTGTSSGSAPGGATGT